MKVYEMYSLKSGHGVMSVSLSQFSITNEIMGLFASIEKAGSTGLPCTLKQPALQDHGFLGFSAHTNEHYSFFVLFLSVKNE